MNQPTQSRVSLEDGWSLRPSVPRIDDLLRGGSENYRADRHLAGLLVESAPWLPDMVQINGLHRPKAVGALANLPITQFLDLGCGLPTDTHGLPHTYDVARAVHKDARVVYVDIDPHVYAHARTVLDEADTTEVVCADIRHIDALLDAPSVANLVRSGPIAVVMHDLLPWVSDEAAEVVMASLRERLPAGSAISLTHASTDMSPEAMGDLADRYATFGVEYRPRSLDQIQALLAPWVPLMPGIVPTGQWRAEKRTNRRTPPPEHSFAYAAIVTPGPLTST